MTGLPGTSPILAGVEAACLLKERLHAKVSGSDGAQAQLIRVAVPLESPDLLVWLGQQSAVARFYFRSRERDLEYAAICFPRFGLTLPAATPGMLDFSNSNEDDLAPPYRVYNSFSFRAEDRFNEPTSALPSQLRFHAPHIELVRVGEQAFLACTLQSSGELDLVLGELTALNWDVPIPAAWPRFIDRQEAQSHLQWAVAVNRVVAAIGRDELQKVVLARRSRCIFDQPLDPWSLLLRLRDANPDCYLFGIDHKPHDAFIGASPERLYKRIGNRLVTEALAGTRPRGVNSEEDLRYRNDLMHSAKDRTEHRLVVEGIVRALRPLTSALSMEEEPTVVGLTRVQHLSLKIQAELRPGVSDHDLIKALQPTPAVGGSPKDQALEMIQLLEPFDRGPYAGPIGWASATEAEFAVAIRSALVRNERLDLYAGAGIVEGSDPNSEWDEIDQKLNTFAAILTAQ